MPLPGPLALLIAVAAVCLLAAPTARGEEPVFVAKPVEHVDTLIGTGTGGAMVGEINNFPGATVPLGMVQYSPDTTDTYAGYDHGKERSTGFSMTHASVGCSAFGDIPMLPTTTPIGSQPWSAWERIAHDDTERGAPGYYTVRFPDTGVIAELTATTRTGVGRFHYPANGASALLHVRPGGSLAGNSAASIHLGEDNTTITGSATTGDFCGKDNTYTLYFAMTFSRPFISYGTWDGDSVAAGARRADSSRCGGYVEFPAGTRLEVHTALSYISIDAARANLAAEAAGFNDVRAAAVAQWNAALSGIAVAGSNDADITMFYTSLYRSLLHPNTFNDADGRYLGFDGAIHTVARGHTQYANFSDWDTYRCLAALQALLFPDRASDMAQSLVNDAEQSGSLPRWALANVATGEMSGDNVVPLIVNLYTFGATNFDARTALRFMVDGATRGGAGLGGYVERPGIVSYLQHEYAPSTAEFDGNDVSITLEWSVDDFAIARFADALGDTATAEEFQRRSQYWHNLVNPVTGNLASRDDAGNFVYRFWPRSKTFGQDGFDEGNAEQYLWLVPHNVAGLVAVLGGRQAVADRLDRFTTELNVGPDQPSLWIGNEPNFGVPWLYNYLGQPWKTQQTVDRVRSGLFAPSPDGEPGNDDLGAMSSWYVWAALGLYPATAGTALLTVNTPLFDRIEIRLRSRKTIRITAADASSGLRYITGLRIDGQPSDQTFVPESLVHAGGDIRFSLSASPDPVWGAAESAAPPSFPAPSRDIDFTPDSDRSGPG